MCGIFGYIGEKPARPILMEGLRKLEYRGYDSAGIVIKNGALQIHKKKGKVSKLESILPNALKGEVGIAHTRWATHGEANDTNAHPHSSADESIAIVHNGIIENAKRLRKHLEKAGYNFSLRNRFRSPRTLNRREYKKGAKPITAVKRALKRANGTWGLCVIFREEEEIIVARNGSPIVLGKDNNQMFISSDPHALSKAYRQSDFLEDGEIASVDKNGFEITTLDGKTSTTTITILEDEWGDAELGDYPHFMLKEIHEQPEALRQCISGRCQPGKSNIRLGGIGLSPSQLRSIPHVRLIGCGTSLHACEVGQLAIEALARLPAVSHVASEFRYTNPVINPKAIHWQFLNPEKPQIHFLRLKKSNYKEQMHGVSSTLWLLQLQGNVAKVSTFIQAQNNLLLLPRHLQTWSQHYQCSPFKLHGHVLFLQKLEKCSFKNCLKYLKKLKRIWHLKDLYILLLNSLIKQKVFYSLAGDSQPQ